MPIFIDVELSDSDSDSEQEEEEAEPYVPPPPRTKKLESKSISSPSKIPRNKERSNPINVIHPQKFILQQFRERHPEPPSNELLSKALSSKRQKRPSFDLSNLPSPVPEQLPDTKRVKTNNTPIWKEGQCRKCGGMGHPPGVCPSPIGSIDNPSSQTCPECAGFGHVSGDCPSIVQIAVPISRPKPKVSKKTKDTNTISDLNLLSSTQLFKNGTPFSNPDYSNYFAQMMLAWQWQWYFWSQSSNMSMTSMINAESPNPNQFGAPIPFPSFGFNGSYSNTQNGAGKRKKNKRSHASPSDLCLRCHKAGHWARECPDAPPSESENSCWKCGQDGHLGKNCNVCFFCGRPGHKRWKCPSQKKALKEAKKASDEANSSENI